MSNSAHGQLILHLYELRREPKLREARSWYATGFQCGSASDLVALMLSGHDQSAMYRMVTTYWEMAAALVNKGALDRDLFLAANTEHIGVFCKIHPHLEEVRQTFGEPDYLRELETLVLGIPEVLPRLERRRKLFKRWAAVVETVG